MTDSDDDLLPPRTTLENSLDPELRRHLFYLQLIYSARPPRTTPGEVQPLLVNVDAEIRRLLLSIAVSVRCIDDERRRSSNKRNLNDQRKDWGLDQCGTLRSVPCTKGDVKPQSIGDFDVLVRNEEPQRLSIREACNKVLHAHLIEIGGTLVETPVDEAVSQAHRMLPNTIKLAGSRRSPDQHWLAELNVLHFTDRAYWFH